MSTMSIGLSQSILLLGICLILTTGCIKTYTPPTAAQPHAVLKLRRTYVVTKGSHLTERFLIQKDFNLFSQTVTSREAENPLIEGVLIHPVPAEIEVTSIFFHYETRLVRESYQMQEPYIDTETYNCGTGTSYRTCTRQVTRYRFVTKYRYVIRDVEIADLSCRDLVIFQPSQDHTYLLEWTVQDHNSCNLTCFEQIPNPDGTFKNAQCQLLAALPVK